MLKRFTFNTLRGIPITLPGIDECGALVRNNENGVPGCVVHAGLPVAGTGILALLIDARCAATEDACAGDAEMTANIALADHLNALDNIVQRRIAAKVAMRAGVRVVLFGNTSDAQVLVYAL